MFEIKDNKIIIAGFSIGLPNGLYLTANPVLDDENEIVFCDKDKSFYIELKAENKSDILLENILKSEIELSSHNSISKINYAEWNGIIGYYAFYEDLKQEYFNLLVNKKEYNQKYLDILITSYKVKTNIQRVLSNEVIRNFLFDIRQ